jgi:hypothetical protein
VKYVFYGQVLQKHPKYTYNKLTKQPFEPIELFEERLKMYINKPETIITYDYILKDNCIIKEIEELAFIPQINDKIKINNKECIIVDKKYDIDTDTIHYFTDYIFNILEPNEEEMNWKKEIAIDIIKQIIKSHRKWWQFWKGMK